MLGDAAPWMPTIAKSPASSGGSGAGRSENKNAPKEKQSKNDANRNKSNHGGQNNKAKGKNQNVGRLDSPGSGSKPAKSFGESDRPRKQSKGNSPKQSPKKMKSKKR